MEAALASGSDEKLALAPLGRHLARLPVHPRLGKMLVYGSLLGCVGPVVSVAAAVGAAGRPDALWLPEPSRAQREERKLLCPPRADLVAAGRALDAWRSQRTRDRAQTARALGLHEPALRDALEARDHFVLVLERAGLLPRGAGDEPLSRANRHATNANVVAAVLVGALAPHVARVDAASKADDASTKRAVVASTELSVPKIASARAAGDSEAATTQLRAAVRFDRARLAPSSLLQAADLDAAACHVAFFSRRWDAGKGRLLLGGCAVATPFALLLMCARRRRDVSRPVSAHLLQRETAGAALSTERPNTDERRSFAGTRATSTSRTRNARRPSRAGSSSSGRRRGPRFC